MMDFYEPTDEEMAPMRRSPVKKHDDTIVFVLVLAALAALIITIITQS